MSGLVLAGSDDYQTGLKYGLEPFSPVDMAGKFTAEAGEGLEGLLVLAEGGAEVPVAAS